MTAEQATDLLTAFYLAEVQFRHCKFVRDKYNEGVIRQLAAALTQQEPKFGVMLCGKVGNGKTTLIYALRAVVYYCRDVGWIGPDYAERFSIEEAKDVVRYAKRCDDRYEKIRKQPMLAIDELGREPLEVLDYGNVLNPILDVLEYRYNQQLPTFLTTNLDAREIREKYGDRIADRFNEMLHVIIFERQSYRK